MSRAVRIASLVVLLSSCSAGLPKTEEDHTPFLSELERGILAEINLARTDPKGYSAFVAEWLPYFNVKRRTLPGQETVWTTEGAEAVKQAAWFLERQLPIGELKASLGLTKASRDHVADMGPAGAIGHMGMDNSESGDRIKRYGSWYGKIGEVICYGPLTARDIVIQWIVDDGVPSRAHRTTLFDNDFRFAGVAFGDHAEFGSICVVTFAKTYIENN